MPTDRKAIAKAIAKAVQDIACRYGDDRRSNIYARAHVDGNYTIATNGHVMLRTTIDPRMLTKSVTYADFSKSDATPYPDWRRVWPTHPTWAADVTIPEWCASIKKPCLVGMRFHDAAVARKDANHVEGMDALYLGILPDRLCRVQYFGACNPLVFSARGTNPQWEMVVMPMVLSADSAILRRQDTGAKESEAA